MLIFVKIKMNTFFQVSLFFILFQFLFNNFVNCSEEETFDKFTSEDFWDWMFGESSEDSQNKPLDRVKEEMGHHYGIHLTPDENSITKQEIDFYVFNFHDFDKNKLLDGLEMLAMMHHSDDDHKKQSEDKLRNLLQSKHNSYLYNAALVDTILRNEDLNNDGFLDYTEFSSARSKHHNLKVNHN